MAKAPAGIAFLFIISGLSLLCLGGLPLASAKPCGSDAVGVSEHRGSDAVGVSEHLPVLVGLAAI